MSVDVQPLPDYLLSSFRKDIIPHRMFDRHERQEIFRALTPIGWARVPAHERVLDRLADLLLDADELLAMLAADDAAAERWLSPHVQKVYDDVNTLMKGMTD